MKNTNGLGSERELAADCLFDLGAGAAYSLTKSSMASPAL